MNKFLIILLTLAFVFSSLGYANAQQPQLATFQETVQILIDKQISNGTRTSVTLQSTSNEEIRIPTELEEKIQNTQRVLAVIVTNENQCVLGVPDDRTCIMINISREGIEGGIIPIQDTAHEIGDSLITDINALFDIETKFHSVYVHVVDESNVTLETSGVVSGRGTVSAVYVTPKEETKTMYQKFSSILIPKIIRDLGGFYEIAQNLSSQEDSRMTFSIIPQQDKSLFQLKISINSSDTASSISEIDPLGFLNINSLTRSDYFSDGFYPLNSLIHVVILSPEPVEIQNVNSEIIPMKFRDGVMFPSDFTKTGWSFPSDAGNKIDARFLFGKNFSVDRDDLIFTITPVDGVMPPNDTSPPPKFEGFDYVQIVILFGIVMAAGGAVMFYFKGFRGKS